MFLYSKMNINRSWTPSNTEQSLCRPLVFNQSATNMQSSPLISSKFVSAISGNLSTHVESGRLVTWNRGLRSNSPPHMSGDQMPSLPGRKRPQMPGVCPGLGGGGGRRCWSLDFTGALWIGIFRKQLNLAIQTYFEVFKRRTKRQLFVYSRSGFFVLSCFFNAFEEGSRSYYQEPITRSLQLP